MQLAGLQLEASGWSWFSSGGSDPAGLQLLSPVSSNLRSKSFSWSWPPCLHVSISQWEWRVPLLHRAHTRYNPQCTAALQQDRSLTPQELHSLRPGSSWFFLVLPRTWTLDTLVSLWHEVLLVFYKPTSFRHAALKRPQQVLLCLAGELLTDTVTIKANMFFKSCNVLEKTPVMSWVSIFRMRFSE